MAHIPDGVLAPPVLVAGATLAAAGTAWAIRRMDQAQVPVTAVLSAAFLVGSLIMIPMGPTSGHLMLGGLMGLVLGTAAFPAVFVGLLLQLMLFGIGGVTTLGVNTVNIAMPAVVAGHLLRPMLARMPSAAAMIGAAAGAGAVAMTAALVALSLAYGGESFLPAAKLVGLGYLPLAVVEAAVTAAAAGLLVRVKPDLFPARRPAYAV